MYYKTLTPATALGLAAKNTVKRLKPITEDVNNPAYKTFLAVRQTIVTHDTLGDKWPSGHSRVAMQYTDKNNIIWSLEIREYKGRLYLRLGHEGNSSNLAWESQKLEVGGLLRKEDGSMGFHLSATFSQYQSWRNGVCRVMPETRAKITYKGKA